jgi:general secretion pathway protein D
MTIVFPRPALACLSLSLLVACATAPVSPGASAPAAAAGPPAAEIASEAGTPPAPVTPPAAVEAEAEPGTVAFPAPDIQLGSGELINRQAAQAPRPAAGKGGKAAFNFEGETVHAVVKAILGDLLQQNYVIAPEVQGSVTLAAKSVNSDQAFSLLEMVLGWNNAVLVWADGRYNVLPAGKALTGGLAPRTGPLSDTRGYEVRAVPLQFIAAAEMEKLLKPYAREQAVVSVDPGRNLIVLAGTRADMENYLHTVEVFDVDWLAGMSVGIFPLRSAEVDKVAEQLQKVIGEAGQTPLAGMVRLLPLPDSNSIAVITPQPKYLKDVQRWIERLDTGGEAVRLYTYVARYMKVDDLSEKLNEVFGGRSEPQSGSRGRVAPGLRPVTVRSVSAPSSDIGDDGARAAASAARGADPGVSVGTADFAVTAVQESNSLLVRTTPSQWQSVQAALERMDTMPLQVHIEARIVEVALQGKLEYGVSWFFENAIPDHDGDAGQNGLRDRAAGRGIWGDIGGTADATGLNWTMLGNNVLAAVKALDTLSDVRVLSTPSVLVRNNVEAELNVGENIPVATTSFNPIDGPGSGEGTFSTVQYLQTGVILKVTPRVSSEGIVFMEIDQEVSNPTSQPTEKKPNVSVATKNLRTEAAVRSGETVMLAGLINQNDGRGSAGVPLLSRIPGVGALFGTRNSHRQRSEVVIFITPTVIRDPDEARRKTRDYARRFRALEPIASDGEPADGS